MSLLTRLQQLMRKQQNKRHNKVFDELDWLLTCERLSLYIVSFVGGVRLDVNERRTHANKVFILF